MPTRYYEDKKSLPIRKPKELIKNIVRLIICILSFGLYLPKLGRVIRLSGNIEVTDAISSHVQSRFTAALDNHERQVNDVTVRLADVNGPKGGVDMRCQASMEEVLYG